MTAPTDSDSSSPPLNPAATPFLPAIASLPTLSAAALTATLDLLFEPSPDLHALALPTVRTLSFASYTDLIDTLRAQLLDIADAVAGDDAEDEEGRRRLYGILGSHPRLGEKRKEVVLSGFSAAEQRHLQQGKEEEERELARLNREYEERFPGLRIARGDVREEEREGIRAMCDIAADRASKLLQKSAEEAVENGRS
ncbi:hypothetical protein NEMBOFW57_000076 [Staphylotrichum longicolle]|uniref:Oxo-4-hydroxy-4-carboxy-5-ureidoimidazoline decarboxylase domain-containing protein n=1 Tax=Staphylotrichum longicolle TaxID=669026 RepID=A0AAD4EYZ6_9PEZI|nr:hypothetical protein NEMBOFW57_000076 [Staphylotrichum longicolle]